MSAKQTPEQLAAERARHNASTPAHPSVEHDGEGRAHWTNHGMTKREEIASRLLAGWMASFGRGDGLPDASAVDLAVRMADALLVRLEQP